MRLLRIADIADNRTGGMSRTMYGTGDALAAAGHQVDYLFAPAFRFKGPVQLRRFFVPREIVGLVRGLLRQGRAYDVVEIHEPLAAPYAWAAQCDPALPPLAVFSYGLEERSHAALLAYKRLKGLPVSLKNRWSPLSVVWQARYAVRHAGHVICSNSEDVRHLQNAGVPAEKLTCHHSGVEEKFLRVGRELPGGARAGILFMGSWLMRKGVLDVVPAVTNVLRRHPGLRFTAAGCGRPASEILPGFPPEVHARIQVLPAVEQDRQLIELYASHAILLLPSFFEGQPLVMIEAAALGLAILTTNICGMADFIVDGRNGFTVPVADVEGLSRRLDELVASPQLAGKLGAAARLTAQGHTWTAAAEKIARAYGRLAASRKRAS